MKPYPCIETLIEFINGDNIYRLWVNRDQIESDPTDKDSISTFKNICVGMDVKEAVEWARENISGLNAIQISPILEEDDGIRYGTVAYLVDFSSDVHG